jgi:Holliday junction resolvase RusA-like endonuclease
MTDTEVRIKIPGAPTGKGRPRFVKKTGHAHTPTLTKTAEARIANAWTNAGAIRLPDGPVACSIEAVVSRPGSHWRVNGASTALGARSPWPTKKPDLDNIIKLVGDSLNGLAYRDDADIVQVWAVRRWCHSGERDHTTIVLRPVA